MKRVILSSLIAALAIALQPSVAQPAQSGPVDIELLGQFQLEEHTFIRDLTATDNHVYAIVDMR
jgi:hypothetical protein